jgi:hypothetical protein
LLGTVVAACTAHAVISTGPDGLRTFAVVRNADGSSVPCPAFGLTNLVAGVLDGQAGDRIVLDQTRPGDAAGTFDDPYFASGLIFGDCYPVLMR